MRLIVKTTNYYNGARATCYTAGGDKRIIDLDSEFDDSNGYPVSNDVLVIGPKGKWIKEG